MIPLSGSGQIGSPADSYELKQDEELSEAVAKELATATERHRDTASAFERAKQFLESNLDYLRHFPAEARSAARFLADCMRSDAAPFMGSWNREKAGRLVDEVDDLIRRKNVNHPGYRSAADGVSCILYTVKAPMFWAKYPPQPQLLRL